MERDFERLRSRRTLLAAEEGDPVLFTEAGRERAKPLKVTDVGGNDEKGYYLVVEGPRGGTYTLEEHRGRLRTKQSNKDITNLRFADVADDVKASYREMREGMLNRTYEMMADDAYDYSELSAAATDAAKERVSSLPEDDLRVILMGAPRSAGDADAYAYSPHDDEMRSVAYAVLVDDIADAGQGYANGNLNGRLHGSDEVSELLDEAVALLNSVVSVKGESDLDEYAYVITEDLLDDLSTSDHISILEQLPSHASHTRPIPYGDREAAYERALGRFQAELVEEYNTREELELIGNESRRSLDEFIEETTDDASADADDLLEEVRPEVPNLPLMPDGKMPHTSVDEAVYFHGVDVPVVAGGWTMRDSGIVTDGESRKIVWENDGDWVIIAGANEGERNRWRTLRVNDHLGVLYDGTDFENAHEAAIDYMVAGKDEGPRVRIIEGMDGEVEIEENIDREKFGRRILKSGGYFAEAFSPLFNAGGRALGLVGSGVGFVAGRFWEKYDEEIAELVLGAFVTVAIANSSKVLLGAESGVEYSEDPADAKVYSRYDRGGWFNYEVEGGFPTFFEKGKRAATFALGLEPEEGEKTVRAAMGGKDEAGKTRKVGLTGGSGKGMDNVQTLPKKRGRNTPKVEDTGGGSPYNPRNKKHGGQRWDRPGGMRPSEAADVDERTFADRLDIDDDEVARAEQNKGKVLNAKGEKLASAFGVGASLVQAAQNLSGDDMNDRTAEDVVEEAKDADRVEQLEMPANETDVEVDAEDVEPTGESLDERMEGVSEDEIDKWNELGEIHEDAESIRRYSGKETTQPFDFGEAVERASKQQRELREKQDREMREMEEMFDFENAEEWAREENFYDDEDRDPAEV